MKKSTLFYWITILVLLFTTYNFYDLNNANVKISEKNYRTCTDRENIIKSGLDKISTDAENTYKENKATFDDQRQRLETCIKDYNNLKATCTK